MTISWSSYALSPKPTPIRNLESDLGFICGCLNHIEADCAMVVALQYFGKEPTRNFEMGVRADGRTASDMHSSLSTTRFEHTNVLGSLGANLNFRKHVINVLLLL